MQRRTGNYKIGPECGYKRGLGPPAPTGPVSQREARALAPARSACWRPSAKRVLAPQREARAGAPARSACWRPSAKRVLAHQREARALAPARSACWRTSAKRVLSPQREARAGARRPGLPFSAPYSSNAQCNSPRRSVTRPACPIGVTAPSVNRAISSGPSPGTRASTRSPECRRAIATPWLAAPPRS